MANLETTGVTASEALAEIKELVERRQIEPEEWYRTLCAVREIVERFGDHGTDA